VRTEFAPNEVESFGRGRGGRGGLHYTLRLKKNYLSLRPDEIIFDRIVQNVSFYFFSFVVVVVPMISFLCSAHGR
jgi:hypothetical protein